MAHAAPLVDDSPTPGGPAPPSPSPVTFLTARPRSRLSAASPRPAPMPNPASGEPTMTAWATPPPPEYVYLAISRDTPLFRADESAAPQVQVDALLDRNPELWAAAVFECADSEDAMCRFSTHMYRYLVVPGLFTSEPQGWEGLLEDGQTRAKQFLFANFRAARVWERAELDALRARRGRRGAGLRGLLARCFGEGGRGAPRPLRPPVARQGEVPRET